MTRPKQRIPSAFTFLEVLVVIIIIGTLIALLLPAIQSARESGRRMQCTSNLAQFGIAVKNYELANNVLPPGTTNEAGPIRNVPLGNHMGWMPLLLPYIEQTVLYNQIDFSQGVYAPKNRRAWFAPKPNVASCPTDPNGNQGYRHQWWSNNNLEISFLSHSSFAACHSGTENPIDLDNDGVFFLNSKVRSRDITDGTSYTIFFGETIIMDDTDLEGSHESRRVNPLINFIMPEPSDEKEAEQNTNTLDEQLQLIVSTPDRYVYGSLGWMSGTPGTIRNTGNPPCTYVGPFSNWAMPEEVIQRLWGQHQSSGDVSESTSEAKTIEEKRAAWSPILPPEFWERELPSQFTVGGFGSHHAKGITNMLFGDGAVQGITPDIATEVFQALGNRRNTPVNSEP